MTPGLGVIIFGGLGYILAYAAIANHGRFATHPWAGVVADAYTSPASPGADSGGQGVPGPAPPSGPSGSSKAPATIHHGGGALGDLEHVAGLLGGILGAG